MYRFHFHLKNIASNVIKILLFKLSEAINKIKNYEKRNIKRQAPKPNTVSEARHKE